MSLPKQAALGEICSMHLVRMQTCLGEMAYRALQACRTGLTAGFTYMCMQVDFSKDKGEGGLCTDLHRAAAAGCLLPVIMLLIYLIRVPQHRNSCHLGSRSVRS